MTIVENTQLKGGGVCATVVILPHPPPPWSSTAKLCGFYGGSANETRLYCKPYPFTVISGENGKQSPYGREWIAEMIAGIFFSHMKVWSVERQDVVIICR